MAEEVKQTFERIQAGVSQLFLPAEKEMLMLQRTGGVTGVAIITKDGIPLQTTLDDGTTVQVRTHYWTPCPVYLTMIDTHFLWDCIFEIIRLDHNEPV